jgi:hypothetical protein
VAATGFLPGVLSFLCALSRLERIAHRPTTCSSNLNHLSHLERVLYNWPTNLPRSPALRGHTTNGKTTRAFPQAQQWKNGSGSRLRDRASTHRFGQSDRGCTWISQTPHRLSGSEGGTRFFYEVGFSSQGRTLRTRVSTAHYTLRQSIEWRRTPLTAHLGHFIRMHQG